MTNLSKDDRFVHLQAVIKSNIVGFNLSGTDIEFIVNNLSADIVDVIENFEFMNMVVPDTYEDF
jgi:hypothetical protein